MRHLRKLLIVSLGTALAGCGGPAPELELPAALAEPMNESGSERGVILGMRPLPAAPLPEPRMRLVSHVLTAARGGGAVPAPGTVELIIRLERGGRDVALVQPSEAWLQPGQRVRLTPGARPGLARDSGGT